MRTICIVAQKGGAGKTTLAINLACESEQRRKPAVIIDLDPQASAASWGDVREADFPVVVSAQAARLSEVLDKARTHGASLAIIDTAPHSERGALIAAKSADLVLVPCRPGFLDLKAASASLDICRLANVPAVAVVTAAPPRGTLASEAAEALERIGFESVPIHVHHRAAYQHSIALGLSASEFEPTGKAADEIRQLYVWTTNRTGMFEK